jgi:hypothetical protein
MDQPVAAAGQVVGRGRWEAGPGGRPSRLAVRRLTPLRWPTTEPARWPTAVRSLRRRTALPGVDGPVTTGTGDDLPRTRLSGPASADSVGGWLLRWVVAAAGRAVHDTGWESVVTDEAMSQAFGTTASANAAPNGCGRRWIGRAPVHAVRRLLCCSTSDAVHRGSRRTRDQSARGARCGVCVECSHRGGQWGRAC